MQRVTTCECLFAVRSFLKPQQQRVSWCDLCVGCGQVVSTHDGWVQTVKLYHGAEDLKGTEVCLVMYHKASSLVWNAARFFLLFSAFLYFVLPPISPPPRFAVCPLPWPRNTILVLFFVTGHVSDRVTQAPRAWQSARCYADPDPCTSSCKVFAVVAGNWKIRSFLIGFYHIMISLFCLHAALHVRVPMA